MQTAKVHLDFSSPRAAREFSEHATPSLGIQFSLSKHGERFRATCDVDWVDSIRLHKFAYPDDPIARASTNKTQDERTAIIEGFLRWFSVNELSAQFMRSEAAILSVLEEVGLAYREAGKVREPLDEEVFENLDDGWLSARTVERYCGRQYQSSDPHLVLGSEHLTDLTSQEVSKLRQLLVDTGQWDALLWLAKWRGHVPAAYRYARMCGSSAAATYTVLRGAQGLSCFLYYQRELLRCHLISAAIERIAADVDRWVPCAKARVIDYSKFERVSPPSLQSYGLTIDDFRFPSSELRSLGHTEHLNGVAQLSRHGCKLAAALAADVNRMKMWRGSGHPLDAADEHAFMQNGYWPTGAEVEEVLRSAAGLDVDYVGRFRKSVAP